MSSLTCPRAPAVTELSFPARTDAVLDPINYVRTLIDRDLKELNGLLGGRSVSLWDSRNQIGSELEMVLVNPATWDPAFTATEILPHIDSDGPHKLGPELLRSNLESSPGPLKLDGNCLDALFEQLQGAFIAAAEAANRAGSSVVMAGIMPSYGLAHFDSTASLGGRRYEAMNQFLIERRGGTFDVKFDGIEPVEFSLTNMSFEGITTSHQLHLSAHPDELVSLHNAALLAMGPVLAAACNSPLVCGKRGWHESRLAILQNGVTPERFYLANGWAYESADFFRDLPNHEPILVPGQGLSALLTKDKGEAHEWDLVPSLKALGSHNGTVWKWLRPCYGIDSSGVPHLRLEMRVLPAGPTPIDMVANAALYYGLVYGLRETYPRLRDEIGFKDVERNLQSAAQFGLDAQMHWIDGLKCNAAELLEHVLMPIARLGLKSLGVPDERISYLIDEVIGERLSTGQTGAQWMLRSLDELEAQSPDTPRQIHLRTITKCLHHWQGVNARGCVLPVSRWPLAV